MQNADLKGLLGVTTTAGGFVTSSLPVVEGYLKIIAMLVTISVGCATFVYYWKKIKEIDKDK
jgi:hypothetical protein